MNRYLRASLLAPLVTPLLYCAATLGAAALDPVRRPGITQNLLGGIGVVFAFASPFAYAATFCAALPALWLIRRFGRLTIVRTVLVGAVVGAGVAIALAPSLHRDPVSVSLAPWHGAALGAASAAAWWRLARPSTVPKP